MLRALLIACLFATPVAAQDVTILPGHSDFRLPETRVVRHPMREIQTWILDFPESAEGAPSLDLSAGIEGDHLVIVLTLAGGGDDSVIAVQRRLEYTETIDRRWALMAYGFRQKCFRGGSDDWTDQPCP
ncbi:MAG: hypothetical protein KI788_13105 [Mameliella sp.]|nr:hypothetical protein [Mameliella sp.]